MIALLLLAQLATAPVEKPWPGEGWVHLALSGVILANSTDVATTMYLKGKYGDRFREANPLMRPFAGDPVVFALAKMSVAGAANYYLWRTHERKPKTVIAVALAQTIVLGYVTHLNAKASGLR